MRYLALLFSFLAVSTALADNLTLGIVDLQQLFKQFPGSPQAQAKYDALVQVKKAELEDSKGDLTDLNKAYKKAKNRAEKEELGKKLQVAYQAFQDQQSHVQNELDQANQDMTDGILAQIRLIVSQIAQKHNLDLIVDKGNGIYAKGGLDLTSEVLRAFSDWKPSPTETPSP